MLHEAGRERIFRLKFCRAVAAVGQIVVFFCNIIPVFKEFLHGFNP